MTPRDSRAAADWSEPTAQREGDVSAGDSGGRRGPGRGETKRLSSVATAIALLKAFSEDEVEIGVSSLARRLGVAKSTVHRLAERAGRWTIVYFYPEDDTPGCTTEACQFRDLHERIESEDAEVWGISPDGASSHGRFRSKFGLPFTLLSDEDHAVAERYGAWGLKQNYGREYLGLIRSSVLVGPDGRSQRN